MPNDNYANEPNQSRSEDIIQSILDNTEYDEEARSRIEYLLIELKNAIEGGGGGGGVTSYEPLTEKPKIDNNTLQAGNNSSSDLGLQTKLTFDSVPTENSTNPVTSDGVYTALDSKANSSDVYNKSAVDAALTAKADKSATYTKSEIDTSLGSKQNTISDLPTIRSGAALGATAVQPISGKGLSTNDYTNDEKTKLSGIAEGAEVNEIVGIKVNNTTINPDTNKVINITVPTTAEDVSALPDTTKYAAALSLTINSSTYVMTGQLKDQNGDNLGTAQTIDLPLESVVVGGSYNSQTKKVVLTLQNGNTIEFSVADLVSGLQTELSASNKLNPAYIDYDSTHRAVSDTEKSTWNGKQNALSFDGTYSASTNKAATVSTVTNAVNALDVTGDASVSASKTISAWSETDGKVSISTQDIAIAGTQTTLTGYAKSGTAGQAVAATDNVNQAIGKLEATVDNNKNNILSLTANGGGKNKLQIIATSTTEMTINDDKSVSITVYAKTAKQYNLTGWIPNNYVGMKISGMTVNSNVSTGYFISVQYSDNGSSWANETDIATIGSATILDYPYIRIAIVVRENNNINDVLFKPMISVDGGDFQPYALSNAELTAKEQANESNILLKSNAENTAYKTAATSFGGTNMQCVFNSDMFTADSRRGSVLMMFGTQKASVNNTLLMIDFNDTGIRSIRRLSDGTSEVITAIGAISSDKQSFAFTADGNSYTYPCLISMFANKDIKPNFTIVAQT